MSKMSPLALILPAALGLAFAGAAFAQGHGGQGGHGGHGGHGPRGQMPTFEDLDADSNGEMTVEELQAFMAERMEDRGGRGERLMQHLTDADSDGDGVLTRDELLAAADARAETRVDRMIERLDTDGDGAIAMAEIEDRPARGARMIELFDTDANGTISAEEFDRATEIMRDMRG